jgi:uncharacterized protein
MNRSIFVDTSGFLCLHDETELRNDRAIELVTTAARLDTTNYVLAEFIPLSESRKHDRKEAITFLNDFLLIPRIVLVWIDRKLHSSGMELLESRLDKTYSLCDAVSFLVMREHGLTDALTTDKHFEQEGFTRLLN